MSLLRSLNPSLDPTHLRCLLAVLAAKDGEAEGKVALPTLKQAVAALAFAQAFPVRKSMSSGPVFLP